jgi:hypothetical protein
VEGERAAHHAAGTTGCFLHGEIFFLHGGMVACCDAAKFLDMGDEISYGEIRVISV